MSMRFQILGSSSAGNCALLQTENCKVLVDAGFSARRIGALLEECGESIDSIDAVFLTHEHSDHSAGIKGLSRKTHLKVFANHATAQAVQAKLSRRAHWQIFETGSVFRYRDLEISAFSVPHDAYDPVGFVITQGGDDLFTPRRSVAWCVDLGYVPKLVEERVRLADVLVLESNYEISMLDNDPKRPWSLKQRIKGRHGHLSNESAHTFLNQVEQPAWQRIYLAHLSRDCNDVALLRERFSTPLSGLGGRKCDISVVDPNNGTVPACEL